MTDDGLFGDDVAADYDRIHGLGDTAVDQLALGVLQELASGGDALEFAIGTGRIALPLHARGVPVTGIELSKAMVAKLREKEEGPAIDVTIGDMATTRLGTTFSLVFLIFNTIDNLTSQAAQVACFENAAAHLKPGGRFVIETLVPPIQKVPFGETKLAFSRSDQHWGIDEFDVVTQHYTSHHVRFENGTHRQVSVPFRYAWPGEFDLMARIAGLELEHRWAGWDKSEFTRTSKSHVSVWRKPAA